MKKAIYVLCGAIVAALGLDLFLIPNNIAPGGISGVATVVSKVTNGILPVGILTLILNIPLFAAGYKVLGRQFAVKSIVGTVLFSIRIDAVSHVTPYLAPLLDGQLFGAAEGAPADFLLYAVCGGFLLGIGLGLIFRGGATTGGTDIAARLLQRKLSWLTLGQLVLGFDVLFLFVVALTYGSLTAALYSAVAVFISSKVIDVVEAGVNYAKEIYIITAAPEEISEAIMKRLSRGVTRLRGEGMYTKEEVMILWCVVYNRQLPALRRIADEFDKEAFLIINDVREAKGLY